MGYFLTFLNSIKAASRRISVRLRIGFFIIVTLTAGAAVLTVSQTREIQNANAAFNQIGLPMYKLAQQVELDLNSMLLRLSELKNNLNEDEVEGATKATKADTYALLAALKQFEVFGSSPKKIEVLTAQLKAAETLLLMAISDNSKQHALSKIVQKDHRRIRELLQFQGHLLREMSVEATGQTESILRGLKLRETLASNNMADVFSKLFLNSINIDTIGQALESIKNSLTFLESQSNDKGISRQKSLIQRKIQNIVGRLADLPRSESRKKLALHTGEMSSLILGKNGLFAKLEAQGNFDEILATTTLIRNSTFVDLTNIMTDMVGDALQNVGRAANQLNDAVIKTVVVTCLGFFAIITTVVLISQFIIENQFTQRIKALTTSVDAIANGQLDHTINIKGRDELGEMARALTVFRENARNLRRSNDDLEKFAYVAAHDLRSPLAAISDLSIWISEDDDNILSPESDSYLILLQQRARRLKRLLADLLDYALVGQDADAPRRIDIKQMVNELALQSDKAGRFNISHSGPDIAVLVPRTAVQQILANLIENAIKHHDNNQGNVTVIAKVIHSILMLEVIDDGPGIEPRHRDRIFELFQTLKPRDEVEGSGLGLAIVSKLVARHNGTVSLYSDPSLQRGARFEVQLPLVQDTQIPVPDTDFITSSKA